MEYMEEKYNDFLLENPHIISNYKNDRILYNCIQNEKYIVITYNDIYVVKYKEEIYKWVFDYMTIYTKIFINDETEEEIVVCDPIGDIAGDYRVLIYKETNPFK